MPLSYCPSAAPQGDAPTLLRKSPPCLTGISNSVCPKLSPRVPLPTNELPRVHCWAPALGPSCVSSILIISRRYLPILIIQLLAPFYLECSLPSSICFFSDLMSGLSSPPQTYYSDALSSNISCHFQFAFFSPSILYTPWGQGQCSFHLSLPLDILLVFYDPT